MKPDSRSASVIFQKWPFRHPWRLGFSLPFAAPSAVWAVPIFTRATSAKLGEADVISIWTLAMHLPAEIHFKKITTLRASHFLCPDLGSSRFRWVLDFVLSLSHF